MRLVDIESIQPAAYNPREVDQARLEIVKLSLQKLGFLSPVYVTPSGEIISGHQRTTAAKMLGYSRVPVEEVETKDLNTLKALNILFNRATNDFSFEQSSHEVTTLLQQSDVASLAEALPDVPPDTFPCMDAREEPIAPYLSINAKRWIKYALNTARALWTHKVMLPIVVDPDGKVINGIGRLELLAVKKKKSGKFIHISHEQAAFAHAMLNWLSMDFALEKQYADLLRFNSFRRARRVREGLGRGFIFPLIGREPTYIFDITKPKDAARWKKMFGTSVVDFGAGHLTETKLLRAAGVDVTPFEPYHITVGQVIDKEASLAIVREFLADVARGKQFTSVFISSVLNSVPFYQDRVHIVKICAALCNPQTRVYAVATNITNGSAKLLEKQGLAKTESGQIKTRLHYEPNVILGDITTLPKVQKYHAPRDFYELFKTAFQKVQAGNDTHINTYAIAQAPLPLKGLRDALAFEFDLPYPDGSRMGMVDEAIRAFEHRLGKVE